MIIGITGKACSGKDTVGKMIQDICLPRYDWQIVTFSHKVKEVASILTGIPVERFYERRVKEHFFKEWGMTGREMLQKIGTDCMREHLHKDVWVKGLFVDYFPGGDWRQIGEIGHIRGPNEYPNWIITDVRFLNEAEAIQKRQGIVLKLLKNWDNPDQHQSEKEVEEIKADFVINNTSQSLRETQDEVKNFLKIYGFLLK